MAMEIRRTICGPNDTSAHDGPILCVAYNPARREIFTGSQDTLIKTWLSETGEHVRTLQEHKGWVTGLAFSPELRVLFSCSIDGRVLVWNKGDLIQKEKVGAKEGDKDKVEGGGAAKGGPLHCLAWDARRHSLVVGANGHIWVFAAIPEAEMTPTTRVVIRQQSLLKDAHAALGPENALVRGIISTVTGKIFSVGYDRRLCMWDTDSNRSIGGKGKRAKKGEGDTGGINRDPPKLKMMGDGPVECHDGAISAMTFDPDNNWIITGSYDRQVKIWAGDSKKPVAIIDEKNGIDDTVSGLAYCPATKTLWMSSNSASPLVYDPRSATDITPFLQQTDTSASAQREAKERILKLFRIEQTGELVASTSTRNLLIWRFNPNGAAAILRAHTDWAEVLAHCYKKGRGDDGEEDSMVLFSGGADSLIRRWEPASRMNPYIYSQTESLAGHSGAVLCALYCEEVDMFVTGGDDATMRLWPVQDVDPNADDDDMSFGPTKPGAPPGGAPPGSQPPLVLREHTDRVTGLIAYGSTIGSVSWDLSIRLWDLRAALRDIKNAEEPKSTHVIVDAHDDYILSMAHSPELGQIASASADQGVKLWDLNVDTEPVEGDINADGTRTLSVPEGRKGKQLCGLLKGHAADVSHVKWNAVYGLWVSGSEDHTVRCWTPDGVQKYEIRPPGDAVTALAIDANGFILVASMDSAVRVYDVETQEVVQQHIGHSDAVRCIIHVVEKQQYLTASWDRTIRVWRAHAPAVKHWERPEAEGEEGEEALLDDEGEEGAPATGGVGAAPPDTADGDDEDEFVPYSVRFPLIEPKCLADRGKGSGDKFMRKVGKEDGAKGRAKKGNDEDALAAKPPQGLAAKLAGLEDRLKAELKLEPDKGGAGAVDKRGRRGQAQARGAKR